MLGDKKMRVLVKRKRSEGGVARRSEARSARSRSGAVEKGGLGGSPPKVCGRSGGERRNPHPSSCCRRGDREKKESNYKKIWRNMVDFFFFLHNKPYGA